MWIILYEHEKCVWKIQCCRPAQVELFFLHNLIYGKSKNCPKFILFLSTLSLGIYLMLLSSLSIRPLSKTLDSEYSSTFENVPTSLQEILRISCVFGIWHLLRFCIVLWMNWAHYIFHQWYLLYAFLSCQMGIIDLIVLRSVTILSQNQYALWPFSFSLTERLKMCLPLYCFVHYRVYFLS